MEQLAKVKSMYGDVLNRLRTEDGKLYYLSNWYGVDEDASSAFQIRYDYLCELVGKERQTAMSLLHRMNFWIF